MPPVGLAVAVPSFAPALDSGVAVALARRGAVGWKIRTETIALQLPALVMVTV